MGGYRLCVTPYTGHCCQRELELASESARCLTSVFALTKCTQNTVLVDCPGDLEYQDNVWCLVMLAVRM